MAETYFIFLKDTSQGTRCLDVGSNGVSLQANNFSVPSLTQNWKLYPAPGWETQGGCYLLNLAQQKFAAFGNSPIQLVTFDATNVELFLLLQPVGDGWVAINNHNASRVMDTNMSDPNFAVSPYKWNGGANQQWRLVNASIPFSAT
jgi:hypothetical protein